MKMQEFEMDLPLLRKRYKEILARLETQTTRNRRKASRRAVVEHFLIDREVKATAYEFGISKTAVRDILCRAIRVARELEGRIPPMRRKMHPLQ